MLAPLNVLTNTSPLRLSGYDTKLGIIIQSIRAEGQYILCVRSTKKIIRCDAL